jgi:hypothetical protein
MFSDRGTHVMAQGRAVRVVVIAALLLLFFVGGVAWVLGSTLVEPQNHAVSLPAGFEAQGVSIPGSGHAIAGWWVDGGGESPVVLLLHGVRADRSSMVSRAQLLMRHGFSVLLIDLQAQMCPHRLISTHLEMLNADVLQFIREIGFAASYIFSNRIQRIQRAHFICTLFAAVDYHPIMKADDSVAAGACMSPWKHRMKKTCNGAAQHGPAKAQRVATVLKVRLAHGSGVIRKQPANGSKYHVNGPPRFGLLGRAAAELSHDRSGRDKRWSFAKFSVDRRWRNRLCTRSFAASRVGEVWCSLDHQRPLGVFDFAHATGELPSASIEGLPLDPCAFDGCGSGVGFVEAGEIMGFRPDRCAQRFAIS